MYGGLNNSLYITFLLILFFSQAYSSNNAHNNSSIRNGYMSASPDRARTKPMPAGSLNAKTLAEENLKGFRLRNL